MEHAIQTSAAARKMYPSEEYDWFHVTAFVHDLGKILSVTDESKGLVGDPMWCVAGDNFPVGCQFSDANIFPKYFESNPDTSNPKYNTKLGIYKENCGLKEVQMCWGHDEYMYHV